jgi:GT2 family glycosyltransferase
MNSKKPAISIIIPNFNGQRFLAKCLQSLYSSLRRSPFVKYEIILVDNASSDNSPKMFTDFIAANHIKLSRLIRLSRNFGFSYAVNYGIKVAQFDFVHLLNNDIVLDPKWFSLIHQSLLNNFSNPSMAVFSGTVLNYDGTKYESQGLTYYPQGRCLNISNQKPYKPSSLDRLPSSTIWGASAATTVYRKAALKKVGLFDSDFFAYEEDVDLCLRLNHYGFQTLYIPQAISYHFGGGTSSTMGNFRQKMDAKNWFFIILKNYSSREIISHFFPILIERLRNLSGLIKATPKSLLIPSLWETYSSVIRYAPKILKKRYA